MAFIPVPNGVKVVVEFQWDGQVVIVRFYVETPAAPTVLAMESIADEVEDWLRLDLMPDLTTDIAVNRLILTDESTSTGAVVERAFAPVIGGADATDSVPNNVALCVTLQTASRGRSFRGRMYLPGIGEAAFTGSIMAAVNVATYVTIVAALGNRLTTAGFDLVVVSKQANGVPRATAVLTPVTAYRADGFADSQRRRLPGRGN